MLPRREALARLTITIAVAVAALACSGTPVVHVPPPASATVVSPTPPCEPLRADCDGKAENACEIDLASAADHCGACGTACDEGERCSRGACVRASVLSIGTQACLLGRRGTVRCWGKPVDTNDEPTAPPRPRSIAGLTDPVALDVGSGRTCAIERTGQVKCWTDGDASSAALPDDAVAVAVTAYQGACSLSASGALHCTDADMDRAAASAGDLIALVADKGRVCAITRASSLTCWGYGTSGDAFWEVQPAARLWDAGRGAVRQVSLQSGRGCAARRGGDVFCWQSELGGNGRSEVVFGVTNAIEVAVAEGHTCALRADGHVFCWGTGVHGELGNGEAKDRSSPVPVDGLSDAIHIAAARQVTCALRRTGAVACWGSREGGRLGDGAGVARRAPVEIAGISDAVRVSVGSWYGCALRKSGKVSCWGRGLGDAEQPFLGGPMRGVPAAEVPGVDHAVTLHVATEACAVDTAGKAICWPSGRPQRASQLTGLPPVKAVELRGTEGVAVLRTGGVVQIELESALTLPSTKATTTRIAGIGDAEDLISIGLSFCVIRRSGKVVCAPHDFPRPMTIGLQGAPPPPPPKPVLVDVKGVADAVRLGRTDLAFCALRKDFQTSCWKLYTLDDAAAAAATAAVIAPSRPAVRPQIEALPVSGGTAGILHPQDFLCALQGDGKVVCEGYNSLGQRGTGDDVAADPGTPVVGLDDAVDVSTSPTHACAVRRTGAVVCWGDDRRDESGGTVAPFSPVPIDVAGVE